MKRIAEVIIQNKLLYARIIVFFCFFGHGLVSLNLSPGYRLHYNILSSVTSEDFDADSFLRILAVFDLAMAFLFLFNVKLVYVIPVALTYLLTVGTVAGIFYMQRTGGYFGLSEFFRRLPWMFTILFLWFAHKKGKNYLYLLRVGLAFAFIAHGLSSLGFFGLSGGHVELASKILTEEAATKFVYYSGFTDTFIGLLMIIGILSRWAAIVGCFWLLFIVYLSFLTGLPEGLFRTGFLLICIYVSLDKRCHTWKEEAALAGVSNS